MALGGFLMLGSTLSLVKAALISELQDRLPNVIYPSPSQSKDMIGEDGTGDAIWWEDGADGTADVVVMTGGPHWFDEDYTLTLVCQSLGQDTDATQATVDTRAASLLGEAIGILATDPTIGIADTAQYELRTVLPDTWRYESGSVDGSEIRNARFELTVAVSARLMLEAS